MANKPEYIEGPADENDEYTIEFKSYAFQIDERKKTEVETDKNGKIKKGEHILCTELKAGMSIPVEKNQVIMEKESNLKEADNVKETKYESEHGE